MSFKDLGPTHRSDKVVHIGSTGSTNGQLMNQLS